MLVVTSIEKSSIQRAFEGMQHIDITLQTYLWRYD